MKHVLFLALRYLRFNKIKTIIMVFSIAAVVYLPVTVNLLVREYQRELLARAASTPLVAGAPGSRFDLVLHALYFRSKPARDLALADVEAINDSGLALAIPIICKHTARGFPVVGTTLEYFDFRGLRLAEGEGLAELGDCVLGSGVAAALGLKPGGKLMSDPENVFDLAGSYPLNMRVAGVLVPTGTADDGAVFVDVKTAWLIMGLMHGHQDAGKADPSLLLGRDKTNVTASAALLPYQEVTRANVASFHMHGDSASYPVGAIIAVPHDEKSAAILRGRYQDPKANAQLLVPKVVVAETLDLVFRVKRFFDAQAGLVGVATGLLLALVVMLSVRLRRGEMATMHRLGCARGLMVKLVLAELCVVGLLSVGLALTGAVITMKVVSLW
jgi:putative ABC transport system permease protein